MDPITVATMSHRKARATASASVQRSAMARFGVERRHLWSTVGCDLGGLGMLSFFMLGSQLEQKKNRTFTLNLWDMKNI